MKSPPLRVLIAPDKFKGTLSAPDVCAAITKGWKSVRAADELELLPMSDGGDGFGEAMGKLLKTKTRSVRTLDAAHRPITVQWWWEPKQKLAIIEAARVNGLALLAPKKFHPFQLDTLGLGRVLEDVARNGVERCLIGIGGSATNDAGFGLACALGWKFFDRAGGELDQWWQLSDLTRIVPPRNRSAEPCAALPLPSRWMWPTRCSARAGVRAFMARKKVCGQRTWLWPKNAFVASPPLWKNNSTSPAQKTPGAGAAGGLGFGLMAFTGAHARPGFEIFAEAAGLEKRIRAADLVITGEGAMDRQSFMGKGVGRIALLCEKLKNACIVIAGVVNVPANAAKLFLQVAALTEITSLEQAKRRPAYFLEKLSAAIVRRWT